MMSRKTPVIVPEMPLRESVTPWLTSIAKHPEQRERPESRSAWCRNGADVVPCMSKGGQK